MNLKNRLIVLLFWMTMLAAGCSDDRAVELSREAADRQAAQNRDMAQLNREVTTAHRELTERQQGVQEERSDLNTGWDDLESERQQIASDRRTESFLAALVPVAGTVVVIVSAIYFAGLLLRTPHAPEAVDAELCELLVTELAADQPHFLPLRDAGPEGLLSHTSEAVPLDSIAGDPDS